MPKDELQILRARLNAHRELIVEILSQLMASDIRVGGGALGGPGDDLAVMDQEEDPGVLPTEAFAEQAESGPSFTRPGPGRSWMGAGPGGLELNRA